MNPYSPTKAVFDHVAILTTVDLFEAEMKCLNAALAPLNMKEQYRLMPLVAAIGDNMQKQELWVSAVSRAGEVTTPVSSIHLAFKAKDRGEVDEFHRAAVAAGATDDGSPGIRKEYHPGYYAAFIVSPSGHRYEAVFHDPELAPGGQ